MTSRVVKKVASIPTFRPRIQELVISREIDTSYLVGPQPLLKSLTISGNYPSPLERIMANATNFGLEKKRITTLHLYSPPNSPALPDSLLQRLQTLHVGLKGDPVLLHEYCIVIQKACNLRALHITPDRGSAPAVSHPSVPYLSIVYPELWNTNEDYSLEEVKMPRLQALVIEASCPKPLTQLKLIGALVLSLRLTCRPRRIYGNTGVASEISWVDGIVHLLRSISHLKTMEISAPSSLVSDLSEALENDRSLCTELESFTFKEGTDIRTEGDNKKATFDQLREKVANLMMKRQCNVLAH